MEDNSNPLTLTRVWESTVSDATTQIQSANQEAGKLEQHQPLGRWKMSPAPPSTTTRLKEQRAGEKDQRQQEETSPAGGGGGTAAPGSRASGGITNMETSFLRAVKPPTSLEGGQDSLGPPPPRWTDRLVG